MTRDETADRLQQLGADELGHINGSLLAYLEGTRHLLRTWGSRPALCEAGLYHAVYGTAGYGEKLLTLADRARVAGWIGVEAEEIVYVFSACDRDHFYAQIMRVDEPEYRDRFTGQRFHLPHPLLTDLCELTMANELQIASGSQEAEEQARRLFHAGFARMERYVCPQAFLESKRILGPLIESTTAGLS